MNDREIEAALDRLLADLRAEALELHRKGVPLDKLVQLALDVCNAKALGTLRVRQQLAVTAPRGVPRM